MYFFSQKFEVIRGISNVAWLENLRIAVAPYFKSLYENSVGSEKEPVTDNSIIF